MDDLAKISLEATVSITNYSKRTWWRRIDKNLVKKLPPDSHGRTMLIVKDIHPHLLIDLNKEDLDILIDADNGNENSQLEIGTLMAINTLKDKSKKKQKLFNSAIYWLELAAKKGQCDAMHWIGILYASNNDINNNENLSLMWISKAANHGHIIAQNQISAILEKLK